MRLLPNETTILRLLASTNSVYGIGTRERIKVGLYNAIIILCWLLDRATVPLVLVEDEQPVCLPPSLPRSHEDGSGDDGVDRDEYEDVAYDVADGCMKSFSRQG